MTLSWGMVAIPVQLFAGTEDSSVSRSEYVKDVDSEGNITYLKVGRQSIVKDTGEKVDSSRVVKCIETEKGIVEVSDDEIANLVGAANGTASVVCFIKQSALFNGTYILGDLKQLRPAKRTSGKQKVHDPAATKSFALLMAAMRKTASFAVLKVTTRGNPQFAALLPNGDLYMLRFEEEVRERLPMPEAEIAQEEIEMGVELVTLGIQDTPPTLHDDASRRVVEYAEKKASGSAQPVAAPEPQEQGQDLMAALSAAVKQAKGDGDG